MTRAVVLQEMPPVTEELTGWSRSLKRAGTMFHAHQLGMPVCGVGFYLDRNDSVTLQNVGQMKHFGLCPRCVKLVNRLSK